MPRKRTLPEKKKPTLDDLILQAQNKRSALYEKRKGIDAQIKEIESEIAELENKQRLEVCESLNDLANERGITLKDVLAVLREDNSLINDIVNKRNEKLGNDVEEEHFFENISSSSKSVSNVSDDNVADSDDEDDEDEDEDEGDYELH